MQCVKAMRVELDLVFAHEAADPRDLRDAGVGLESVAELPVLQRAQVGQAQAMLAVDQHVLVDPSGAGSVGPELGSASGRQPATELLQVLQNSRARPVDIRAIFP